MKKVHRHKTPQGGWGVGSEGAYSKSFIMVFTMLEVDANGPYRSRSKGFTSFIKIRSRKVLREVFE